MTITFLPINLKGNTINLYNIQVKKHLFILFFGQKLLIILRSQIFLAISI